MDLPVRSFNVDLKRAEQPESTILVIIKYWLNRNVDAPVLKECVNSSCEGVGAKERGVVSSLAVLH